MSIRRPSISSPEWLFQDFAYQNPLLGSAERYLQVKWSGEPFERISQTYDYSDPPFSGTAQRGGEIVAQIDYTVNNKLVTINDWFVNWRDDYPLRLAAIHLRNCLYPPTRFAIRVAGDEVYNQAGEPVLNPRKDPFAFWVSEEFSPTSNNPNDYLLR